MSDLHLTAEAVTSTFDACCEDNGDVEADMIVALARFDRRKLADHAEQIAAMLLDLPNEFLKSGGGGWSFLNACLDREGNQWTGLHLTMGMLFALGQAIGMVECQFPRELWPALPGGMPYYAVLDSPAVPSPGAAS